MSEESLQATIVGKTGFKGGSWESLLRLSPYYFSWPTIVKVKE